MLISKYFSCQKSQFTKFETSKFNQQSGNMTAYWAYKLEVGGSRILFDFKCLQ